MKNVFDFGSDDKKKFNRELKIKNNLYTNFISNEVDRFYPNIQELRKLKIKKPINKNIAAIMLKRLQIKQNQNRLLKSASDPMILTIIKNNKNKFQNFLKKKNASDTKIFEPVSHNEEIKSKIKYRNRKLIKSKSFNDAKSYLITNESINKYIPRSKYFPKIPKFFNSIGRFKRNLPNNEYLTIKSHLSSSSISISYKEKKVPKIYQKLRSLSNISKQFYLDIKNDIKRFKIDNLQNPYRKLKEKEKRIKIKRIKNLENFIEYKKPFF